MTKRSPSTPAPGPLEEHAARFDGLFSELVPSERDSAATWRGFASRGTRQEAYRSDQYRARDQSATRRRPKEPSVVPLRVEVGPQRGQRAPPGALAGRSENVPEWLGGTLLIDETGDRKAGVRYRPRTNYRKSDRRC